MSKKLKFKKIRLLIAWPYFLIASLLSVTKDQFFREAAPFIGIGIIIRFLSAGYIEKSKELTTAGPYAFLRHPLYLGNFLIGLGFAIISHNLLIFTYFLLGFPLFYYFAIKEEESELLKKFKEDFIEYKNKMPAFFPRLLPYPKRKKKKFDFKLLIRNGELIRIFGLLLLIEAFYFREEFLLEKEPFAPKHFLYSLTFLVFTGIIFINIKIRHNLEKNKL